VEGKTALFRQILKVSGGEDAFGCAVRA